MKRRHKNKYVEHWETGKILINIATTHYTLDNLREALKYYSHALDVFDRVKISRYNDESLISDCQVEQGKVNLGCASIYVSLGDREAARMQYL